MCATQWTASRPRTATTSEKCKTNRIIPDYNSSSNTYSAAIHWDLQHGKLSLSPTIRYNHWGGNRYLPTKRITPKTPEKRLARLVSDFNIRITLFTSVRHFSKCLAYPYYRPAPFFLTFFLPFFLSYLLSFLLSLSRLPSFFFSLSFLSFFTLISDLVTSIGEN